MTFSTQSLSSEPVSLEEQRSAFIKYRKTFKDKNCVPKPYDKVYESIRRHLGMRMSVGALYISVKQNYDFFFKEIEEIEEAVALIFEEAEPQFNALIMNLSYQLEAFADCMPIDLQCKIIQTLDEAEVKIANTFKSVLMKEL